MSPFKAVIFDHGGVLIPSPLPLFHAFESANGLPSNSVIVCIASLGEESAWARLERGELTDDEFGRVMHQQFMTSSSAAAVAAAVAAGMVDFGELLRSLQEWSSRQLVRLEMMEAIRCIRAEGMKTAVLTNIWKVKELPFADGLFDVVFESAREGVRKPQDAAYLRCVSRLDVAPHECIFLDDFAQNVAAAQRLGIASIRVGADPLAALIELEKLLGFPLNIRGTST